MLKFGGRKGNYPLLDFVLGKILESLVNGRKCANRFEWQMTNDFVQLVCMKSGDGAERRFDRAGKCLED